MDRLQGGICRRDVVISICHNDFKANGGYSTNGGPWKSHGPFKANITSRAPNHHDSLVVEVDDGERYKGCHCCLGCGQKGEGKEKRCSLLEAKEGTFVLCLLLLFFAFSAKKVMSESGCQFSFCCYVVVLVLLLFAL